MNTMFKSRHVLITGIVSSIIGLSACATQVAQDSNPPSTQEGVGQSSQPAQQKVDIAATSCPLLDNMPTDPERVTLPVWTAEQITQTCDETIAAARTCLSYFGNQPLTGRTTENFLVPFDLMMAEMEDGIYPVYLLKSVSPDKSVREVGDKCVQKFTDLTTDIFQNEPLYKRFEALNVEGPVETKYRKDILDAFVQSGVNLPPAKRDRAKAINKRITELSQKFSKNVRENGVVVKLRPAEVKGMPESWRKAVKRDKQGNYLATTDYPVFRPFMRNAKNAAARKRYLRAYYNRGSQENIRLLDEIFAFRRELADLHKLKSFAHLATKTRMVENPETVHDFLDKVATKVTAAEKNDIEQLRQFKAKRNGTPLAKTTFNRWDYDFYSEQLKKSKYSIDQEKLRQYFPTQDMVTWSLYLASELYGVEFAQVKVPTWHEDVIYYDVFNKGSKEIIGGIYLDLYPREGKYKHAAAFGVRSGSTVHGRKPYSVLVTNFDRKGLTHNELETMLHEFGHVLHGVLSTTKYASNSGTNVARDFVEAPSQMFEAWARRPESLATIQKVCPDCPVLSQEMIDRLEQARLFGTGARYARQHLYATLDMTLSGEHPIGCMHAWRQLEGATPLGHMKGTQFPGTFGHIAGGYAAGYYGYMWSEVLAVDMLSKFGDNLMNPAIGRSFRNNILARGGEVKPKQLVENFLERDVKSDAFFKMISGE